MLLEPHGRRRTQLFLLSCVHKFARRAEIRALAQLDFGKDQILPVFCDQFVVQLIRRAHGVIGQPVLAEIARHAQKPRLFMRFAFKRRRGL